MPSFVAAPLCLLAVAVPFLFGYTDSPVANFWPLVASWVCVAALLVVASAERSSPRVWARRLAAGLALAAVVAAGIGLVQYALGDVGLSPWIHSSQPGLASGNLRQRNQQATLLALGAWALLWWVQQGRLRGAGEGDRQALGRLVQPALLAAAVAWVAVGNAATASRTGALQWVVLVSLVLVWRRTGDRRALRWACCGAAVYLLAAWALPELLWRWQGVRADALFARFADESQPCTSRLALWSNVVTLIAQRPWTGWGWGELDYAHYITLFPSPRFCALLDNAHNLPLQLAVEWGLPAALLLCAALTAACVTARPWREVSPARQLAWGVLAIVGVHSLLEYPLWYGPFQLVTLFALALLVWTGRRWDPAPSVAPAVALGSAAGAVLLACALVAWDYHRVSQWYRVHSERSSAYRGDLQHQVATSWFFPGALDFARLTTTPLTRNNAQEMNHLALAVLHYSPEPRVIQKLIESAVMLGRHDEAAFHLQRFRVAYPDEHAKWRPKAPGIPLQAP